MRYLVTNLTAVIFASYDLTNKLGVADSLNRRVKDVFDGEPAILPIPNDAPAEIPRIILTSKKQQYWCNISVDRLTFVYKQVGEPDKELSELRNDHLTILRRIAEVMKGEWNANVFRLGFAVGSVAFPEDPIELIKSTYIRDGVLKAPHRLEMHVLDRMTWDKLEINRWCRLSAVVVPKATGEQKALSVVFDVNTIAERQYDFDAESIIAFYDRALAYVSDSLRMLFPTQK